MRIKKNYTEKDVIGCAADSTDKVYCCPLSDYIAIIERGIRDDLELIKLIKEYGANIYMPIHPFIDELNLYAKRVRLSPAQRFKNMVDTAGSKLSLQCNHYNTTAEVVAVSDACKNLLANLACRTATQDNATVKQADEYGKLMTDTYVGECSNGEKMKEVCDE
jgi:uncharacterized CHY-type Zn-finger protein